MRNSLYTFTIILILLAQMHMVPVESQVQSNFDIRLLFPSDDSRFEGVSSAIKQFWNNLLVSVTSIGVTRPIYKDNLLSDDHSWDAALLLYDFDYQQTPMIYEFYSPSSTFGNKMYQISDSQLSNKYSNSSDNFLSLIEQYEDTIDKNERVTLAKELQKVFNEELIWDIPISSNPEIIAYWNGFGEFDIEEGIVRSIYKGAKWNTIPDQRLDSRSDTELIYPLFDANKMPHPLYINSRADRLVIEALYSSAFLMDKDKELHPSLIKSYYHNTTEGSDWYLTLQDNVLWTDRQELNAEDFKFTYDVSSFDWIGARDLRKWRYYESTEIINDTSIKVSFSQETIDEEYLLANTYIIPEHIYNTTFTGGDGKTYLPYVGGYPESSPEWVEYATEAVSAGAYRIKDFQLGVSITVEDDINYWFPNEDRIDTIFDQSSTVNKEAYYFKTKNLGIDYIDFQFSDPSTIDENSEKILFDAGQRDFMYFTKQTEDSDYFSDKEINLEINELRNSGIKLVFNSKNIRIKEYDIRKALALALDYDKIENFLDLGYVTQNTIVSPIFTEYYATEYALENNYPLARDIFRSYGLQAFESTEFISNVGMNFMEFIAIILVSFISTIYIRRRR